MSREDTFAHDIADDAVLDRELLRLAVRVSADLRQQHLEARTITVKLRDHQFRTRSAQRSLVLPIAAEQSVYRVARALLHKLRRAQPSPIRLLGIGLSHFEGRDAEAAQLGLFADEAAALGSRVSPAGPGELPEPDATEPVEGTRERALTHALDRIRARFGAASIVPARLVDRRDSLGPRVEDEPE